MPETEWQRRKRRDRERAAHIAAHGNTCQLCGREPKTKGLEQDHDHRTGQTRGWLCHRCNRALPSWVDSTWLLKARLYLLAAGNHPALDEPPGNRLESSPMHAAPKREAAPAAREKGA